MPIVHDLLGDIETPLSAYWKLAHDEPESFLLESVTGGEQVGRYSVLGVRPRVLVRTRGRHVSIRRSEAPPEEQVLPDGKDPLHILEGLMGDPPREVEGMPKFIGGAVGFLAYDLVRFFERLPDNTESDVPVDDLAMMLTGAVVVFDHAKNAIRVIALAEGTSDGYERARAEIDRIVARLRGPLPSLPSESFESSPVVANVTQDRYEAMVRAAIDAIAAGDGIQVVLSQRFATPIPAHPLTVYRALRSENPSPYMYLLRLDDLDVIGASPELLVGLEGRRARVRPIAGTRPRGWDANEDRRLETELLADEKERAEHVMLVDLGRNDLGRVCDYGSVRLNELMVVERYSHVMHIVSDVDGRLRDGLTAFDLVRASFPAGTVSGFPAGTVSGAPKVRAMEIIDELEPTRRGLYAGAVGYFGANGDADLAIAIRTVVLKNGVGYVQAGAGVVYDSDPTKEYEECRNKARAVLRAIERAHRGLADATA